MLQEVWFIKSSVTLTKVESVWSEWEEKEKTRATYSWVGIILLYWYNMFRYRKVPLIQTERTPARTCELIISVSALIYKEAEHTFY